MLSSSPRLHRLMRNKQSGASLLEVLISILLMAFGMLALGGMQAYSVAAQKNAANRAIAAALANELAEIIRLNPAGFALGKYDVAMLTDGAPPALKPCAFPDCTTPTKLADADLTGFQSRLRKQLPLGGVELSRPAASTTQANLWIVWEEAGVFSNMRASGGTTESAEMLTDNCSATAKNLAKLPRCFYMKVQL